jgi:hypothetical protein
MARQGLRNEPWSGIDEQHQSTWGKVRRTHTFRNRRAQVSQAFCKPRVNAGHWFSGTDN